MSKANGDIDAMRRRTILGGSALLALTSSNLLAGCGDKGAAASGAGGGGGGGPSAAYDGVISVSSAGRLVNGAGGPIQLRGLGLYGLESQDIQGNHLDNVWGSQNSKIAIGPAGPVWPLMRAWKANSVRIALNAQTFLGINYGVLAPSGTAAAPQWVATTAAATSTGTRITVASTAGFQTSAAYGPVYLVDTTPGSKVPANTQILSVTNTTITVNQACTVNNGDVISCVRQASSTGQAKSAILTAARYCREYGYYIIWDCHWSAPRFTFPGSGTSQLLTFYCGANGQPPFIDADAGGLFWTDPVRSLPAWLLATFGPNSGNYNAKYGPTGIGDMIFELFNEPYPDQYRTYKTLDGAAAPSVQHVMLNGGTCDSYFSSGAYSSNGCGIPYSYYGGAVQSSWTLLGYKQAVAGIRALGCTNIIQCNPPGFAQTVQMAGTLLPADTLNPPQISIGWHPYENLKTGLPSGGSRTLTAAENIINGTTFGHAVPMIITEFGDSPNVAGGTFNGPAAPNPDTYVASIHAFADQQPVGGLGVFAFQWTGPLGLGESNNYSETSAGTNVSFTASISGKTMKVTGATPGTIQVGLSVVSGGGTQGTFVVSQTSGTPGGNGVYEISNNQADGTYNWSMLVPSNGEGQAVYNWMINHP
jgi:hypothetical protein